MKGILGLDEFSIPSEDSRTKQLREIEAMLAQPMPLPIRLLDNHAVEFGECQRWSSSDDGQTAAEQNPLGYQAVELHAQMHQQAMQPRDASRRAADFRSRREGRIERAER